MGSLGIFVLRSSPKFGSYGYKGKDKAGQAAGEQEELLEASPEEPLAGLEAKVVGGDHGQQGLG